MAVDQPFNVYREHLSRLSQGLALWNPNPVQHLYDSGHVSIGDVGYVRDGGFIRMFNVTLPWNHPSNTKIGIPMEYRSLDPGPFANVREDRVSQTEYLSFHVSEAEHAETPNDIGQAYQCRARKRGALLSLPYGGHRKDVIRTKVFEDYIKDNVDRWFNWSKEMRLPVEQMVDLILVTGYTLATSWAVAVFDNYTTPVDTSISLRTEKFVHGGAQFFWSNMHGNVEYHNCHLTNDEQPPPQNQCVFIRGFRAKRSLFWIKHLRAAAEPSPDDPDDHNDDEIHWTRAESADGERGKTRFRYALGAILSYIVEKSFKCVKDADVIAIARRLIKDVETLAVEARKRLLHEKQMPLLVENGATILRDPRDPRDNELPVPDEKKATFHPAAKLNREPVPLVIHPTLTTYLLETSRSLDHDHNQELASAVYPSMLSLKLENCPGDLQIINVKAISDRWGVDVIVQDVLKEILRTPFQMRIKRVRR